MKSLAPL